MLLVLITNIYRHPMFWWVIVPLIFTAFLVGFMLWEARFPKNMTRKH